MRDWSWSFYTTDGNLSLGKTKEKRKKTDEVAVKTKAFSLVILNIWSQHLQTPVFVRKRFSNPDVRSYLDLVM